MTTCVSRAAASSLRIDARLFATLAPPSLTWRKLSPYRACCLPRTLVAIPRSLIHINVQWSPQVKSPFQRLLVPVPKASTSSRTLLAPRLRYLEHSRLLSTSSCLRNGQESQKPPRSQEKPIFGSYFVALSFWYPSRRLFLPSF